MLPIQFLDKFLDMPVVVLRQLLCSMVQKTVESPQLHFIDGRRHSLSFRRGSSSWSRLFSGSSRFRSCRSFFGGRCPCCAGRAGIMAGMPEDYRNTGFFWEMTAYVSVFGLVRQWIHFCQSTEAWSFLSWCRGGFPWSCCSAHHGVSTAAVHHQGRRHLPFRGAEAHSHGLTVQADHRDSLIAVDGGRCPCCVVVHIPCRYAGRFPWSSGGP